MAGGPIYKGGIPFFKPGVRFKGQTVVFSNAGAPTNGTSGTYAGKAGKGSLCIDNTNGNVYMNVNTLASPTWQLIAVGAFGAGTATGSPVVTLSSQASAAGIGNGADATDDTLFTFSLPANSLNANTRGVYVLAFGTNGATGNNKTVKLKWGSQTLVTSGTITTNGGAWTVEAWITRTGVGTQQCIAYFMNGAALSVQTQTAGTQDETIANSITLTGASPTSSAANDELGLAFEVQTVG